MLVAWRLAAPEFARAPGGMLSGEGARRYGGRWNSPGRAAVYLADSLALAGMELLVHLGNAAVLRTYRKMPVYIPEELVMHIKAAELPPEWETGTRAVTRAIGDRWLARGQSAVLQVPSAVVLGESNFIVNPNHPNFPAIKAGPITDFRYDPRLAE
ncbi:MAG: RES family NAD+ phosphorylase [Gammaproteobacteria bacterium]|nr:RES family NAD+ phosphorylase [Gammaproteobacteria bacterium]